MLVVVIILFTYVFWLVYAYDYSVEFKNAYNYAHDKGITTVDSIQNARMYQTMTRVEMAKMISNFAINVLWLLPDHDKDCQFYDVSSDLDTQYNYWVTQACKLWLMWIYDDWSKADYFNPDNNVTRWEWATVFSRVLNKSKWSNINNGDPFYKTHMNYLISKWIINNYNNPSPNSEEKRWNVMLMMYRADPNNIVTVNYETWYTKLNPWQTYYNTFYWFQIEHAGDYAWFVEILTWYTPDYPNVVRYYSFLPEKSWDYVMDPMYITDTKKTAESFNQTWLLVYFWYEDLIKKWSKEYNNLINWEYSLFSDYPIAKDLKFTTKNYTLYSDWYSGPQESYYNYVGKRDTEPEEIWYRFINLFWEFYFNLK